MAMEAINATNDDAAMCKLFAINKGYWRDPYLKYFVRSVERKAPEMSRGYFARVQGINTLLRNFFRLTNCKCQVVNLGAGFDTRYWLLHDEGLIPEHFIDVDYHTVSSRKCHIIKSRPELIEKFDTDEIRFTQSDLHTSRYHVIGVDLNDVKELNKKLDECKIDRKLPTIFISECVLVYIDVDKSNQLLRWVARQFPTSFFVVYEQVNMEDRFGRVMLDNLHQRHCDLAGVSLCKSLQTQKKRFLDNDWEGAEVLEMDEIYQRLPVAEVKRIEKLEFLDEGEPLMQLFQHYCICWAYNDASDLGLKNIHFELD